GRVQGGPPLPAPSRAGPAQLTRRRRRAPARSAGRGREAGYRGRRRPASWSPGRAFRPGGRRRRATRPTAASACLRVRATPRLRQRSSWPSAPREPGWTSTLLRQVRLDEAVGDPRELEERGAVAPWAEVPSPRTDYPSRLTYDARSYRANGLVE